MKSDAPALRPGAGRIGDDPVPIEYPVIGLTVTSPAANSTLTLSEPGQLLTVSGSYECSGGAVLTSLTVTFDGAGTAAVLTPGPGTLPEGGTFQATVRGWHAGAQTLALAGSGHGPNRPALVPRLSVPVTVALTHATPTVSVQRPTAGTVVALGESGADVAVTATAADTAKFGRRTLTAVLDRDQRTAVVLAPVAGSTTQYHGSVHLPALPLGGHTLAVTCVCTDMPALSTTTIGLGLTATDAASPHIDVQDLNPPDGGNVLIDPATRTVTIRGTARDTQSGMTGGQATVAAALSAAGRRTTVTPRAPGDFTSWSVTLPATLGTGSVYLWATDRAGNAMAAPAHSSYNVVSSYVPQTLDDRLSELEYLLALMAFANTRLSVGGTVGNVTSKVLAQTLAQPVDELGVPLTAEAAAGQLPVNELRVPVEVLRRHIAAHSVPTGPGQAGERDYLTAAYEALLTAAGTGYAELRLARGADGPTRAALADRLGIPLYGPTGPGSRPDQLDALTLEGGELTEQALESVFGLPATADAAGQVPPPLRTVPQAQLTGWRLAVQREEWAAQDRAGAAGQAAAGTGPHAYTVIVDPDVITEADVLAHSPGGAAVLALLAARRADLEGARAALAQTAASGADPEQVFGQLLDQGLGLPAGTAAGRLQDWQAAEEGGADIGGALADAGLDRGGYDYLLRLQRLAATHQVTATEWADAVAVLTGSRRRRGYPAWAGEEGGVSLSPDTFTAADRGPDLPAYRIDPAARADWLGVLAARRVQRADLLAAQDEVVATAERLALPVLRDALLADVAPTAAGDPGDAMTAVYQLDMRVSGTLRTTRLAQGIAALQTLLTLVRSGDNASVPALAAWRLAPGTTAAAFDTAWQWLATLPGWRAATTAFLFPEAGLDPALLLSGAGGAQPTQAFQELARALLVAGDLDPVLVGQAVAAYESAASAALTAAGVANSGFAYLAGRDLAHQAQLAAWSTALEAKNAALAREVFWAVPVFVAQRLRAAGRYQLALDWYWPVCPYTDATAQSVYSVVNRETATAPAPPDLSFPPDWTQNLDPFHRVAGRPAPYLRASLLAVIGCLADYADAEFAAETDESVADARNLYLAARRLTRHPRLVPVPPAGPGEAALPVPRLATLAGRVEAQLTKLRQGRNIAGLPRTQVAAGAAAIRQPTPYHFKTLLARAQQLTQQAAQLESAYLAALEKYDAKTLQLSDAQHALDITAGQLTVHQAQVQEAADAVLAAQAQQTRASTMVATYQDALAQPSNAYEQSLFRDYGRIRDMQDVMAGADMTIGIASAAGAACSLFSEVFSFGGAAASAGVQIAAQAVKFGASLSLNDAQAQAQANQLQSSIEERKRAWRMQMAGAQQDELIAAAQVTAATDHVATARAELDVARTQFDQADATLKLLRGQFTNADLYKWLSDTLGGAYRTFLQQAGATARLAQAQLAFERAEVERTFIRTDYWQAPGQPGSGAPSGSGGAAGSAPGDVRGLTGAERLAQDLAQLDAYAFSSDSRRLDISQTFSLARLLPVEFLDFRRTGRLAFTTPMSWFDADFPGHYQRLIRQVRLSVVALVPPDRGIRATLSASGISQVMTEVDGQMRGVRLRRDPGVIALTSPMQSSGVFALDPQPEMLLPFEGSGVETSWELLLPKAANPFDYGSVNDVLLTVDYTALYSDAYRARVTRELNARPDRSATCVFSLARDFPDQWYALVNATAEDGGGGGGAGRSAAMTLRDVDFPVNMSGFTVTELALQIRTAGGPPAPLPVTLGHAGQSATATTDPQGVASTRTGAGWARLTGAPPTGEWTVGFDAAGAALFDQQAVEDVVLVVTWSAKAAPWPA
jgi:hypothetical protein